MLIYRYNLRRFNSRTLGRVRLLSIDIEISTASFNSRTLGRVRPRRSIPIVSFWEFQFTHPGKGATNCGYPEFEPLPVSIHAPWEGCDLAFQPHKLARAAFQFTHPGKGATQSDLAKAEVLFSFNSRTLGRVRLCAWQSGAIAYCVSIHAPWEGCDSAVATLIVVFFEFQFTHPGKGATHDV